jgi:hypothetical protein
MKICGLNGWGFLIGTEHFLFISAADFKSITSEIIDKNLI